jgi:hypothetical protein
MRIVYWKTNAEREKGWMQQRPGYDPAAIALMLEPRIVLIGVPSHKCWDVDIVDRRQIGRCILDRYRRRGNGVSFHCLWFGYCECGVGIKAGGDNGDADLVAHVLFYNAAIIPIASSTSPSTIFGPPVTFIRAAFAPLIEFSSSSL